MSIFKTPYTVEKSMSIHAPIETVWKNLTSSNQRGKWSPWLKIDPESKVTNSGGTLKLGFTEYWDGEIIGEGKQTITKIENQEYIEGDLEFLSPFKSQATAKTYVEKKGNNNIKVTWVMESSLPIYLFFMKSMFQALIAIDFQRGLMMLKELSETGELNTSSEIIGQKIFDERYYIGISRTCDAEQMPEKMGQDFKNITKFVKNSSYTVDSYPFTIYHKTDLVKNEFSYTICLPISEEEYENTQEPQDDRFIKGFIKGFSAYTVRHCGSYDFLANSWALAYMAPNKDHIKIDMKAPSVELYITNPEETKEKDYITKIYVPIK